MAETIANLSAVALLAVAFFGTAIAATLANRMEEVSRVVPRPVPVERTARRNN